MLLQHHHVGIICMFIGLLFFFSGSTGSVAAIFSEDGKLKGEASLPIGLNHWVSLPRFSACCVSPGIIPGCGSSPSS